MMVYTQERVSTSHIYVTVQYKNVQFVNSISNFGLTINVHKLMMGYYVTMNFASTVCGDYITLSIFTGPTRSGPRHYYGP